MAKKATKTVKHVLPLYFLYLSFIGKFSIALVHMRISVSTVGSVDRARYSPQFVRTNRSSISYRSAAISQSVDRPSPEAVNFGHSQAYSQ